MKKNDIALRICFIVTFSIITMGIVIKQAGLGEWKSFSGGFLVALFLLAIASHVHSIKEIKKAIKKIADGDGLPDCVSLISKKIESLIMSKVGNDARNLRTDPGDDDSPGKHSGPVVFLQRATGEDDDYVEIACLSTSIKPTKGIANRSMAFEVDTGNVFLFDKERGIWIK